MDAAQETLLTDRQRYWLEHIQACEALGKTVAEYAMAQGLEAKAMYAGKKILVKKGILPRTHRSRFQRAQVTTPVSGCTWRVQLPNGLLVTFSAAVDARTLSTVLTTAAAVE
ncbi:MAG: hypothetical protein ABFS45_18235 [Pseudomonadota bacterium]